MIKLNNKATLEVFIADNSMGRKTPAVLILPGGGYVYISEREKYPIAKKFNTHGYTAFILNYSTYPTNKKITNNDLVNEVLLAYEQIKNQQKEFNIDIKKLFIIGFSAGAHLAALSTNLNPDLFKAVVLAYPAFELNVTKIDKSFPYHLYKLNPIEYITKLTPPTFIWQTAEDQIVSTKATLNYVYKLNDENIPFQIQIYEKGVHGLSLADITTAKTDKDIDLQVSRWFDDMILWLKDK